MFFLLSKIVALLFKPLTWIIILIVIALLSKNKKKKKLFIKISLIALLFFSNGFLVKEFARMWEYKAISPNQINKVYDVGVVLGGGMVSYDDNIGNYIFKKNPDRIMQALLLYKKGTIKKILISGGPGSIVYRNIKEANILKNYLVEIGFNSKDIIADSLSDNTHENAIYSAKILKESFPDGKYLLITSSIHARRSEACFRKAGIIADIFPTNPYGSPRKWDFQTLLFPSIGAFIIWENLFHEIIGYFTYSLMGYI